MTKYFKPNNLPLGQSLTKLTYNIYCLIQEVTQLQSTIQYNSITIYYLQVAIIGSSIIKELTCKFLKH